VCVQSATVIKIANVDPALMKKVDGAAEPKISSAVVKKQNTEKKETSKKVKEPKKKETKKKRTRKGSDEEMELPYDERGEKDESDAESDEKSAPAAPRVSLPRSARRRGKFGDVEEAPVLPPVKRQTLSLTIPFSAPATKKAKRKGSEDDDDVYLEFSD
jgi:hypothetical protein